MFKFTKEEISLCKQVAEKYIKPMEYGDWWNDVKKETLLFSMKKWVMSEDIVKEEMFPLWTISDCLEFLKERKIRYGLEDYRITPNESVVFIFSGGEKQYCRVTLIGKTVLEACLKAVLAVLEEKK